METGARLGGILVVPGNGGDLGAHRDGLDLIAQLHQLAVGEMHLGPIRLGRAETTDQANADGAVVPAHHMRANFGFASACAQLTGSAQHPVIADVSPAVCPVPAPDLGHLRVDTVAVHPVGASSAAMHDDLARRIPRAALIDHRGGDRRDVPRGDRRALPPAHSRGARARAVDSVDGARRIANPCQPGLDRPDVFVCHVLLHEKARARRAGGFRVALIEGWPLYTRQLLVIDQEELAPMERSRNLRAELSAYIARTGLTQEALDDLAAKIWNERATDDLRILRVCARGAKAR